MYMRCVQSSLYCNIILCAYTRCTRYVVFTMSIKNAVDLGLQIPAFPTRVIVCARALRNWVVEIVGLESFSTVSSYPRRSLVGWKKKCNIKFVINKKTADHRAIRDGLMSTNWPWCMYRYIGGVYSNIRCGPGTTRRDGPHEYCTSRFSGRNVVYTIIYTCTW